MKSVYFFPVRSKQLLAPVCAAALLRAHALRAVRGGDRQGPLRPRGVPGRGGGGPPGRGQVEGHGEGSLACGQGRGLARRLHQFVAVPL